MSRTALRLLLPVTVLVSLGSVSGCKQCQSCGASGPVGLPQAVATTTAHHEGGGTGWTCQVTLFDRPNVHALDHLQNAVLAQRPMPASPAMATRPSQTPMATVSKPPVMNAMVAADRTVESWLTPPQHEPEQ